MEFKKIQLNGFKSFADKTNFLIEDGLTGIVGPNGCGKSNIVESLRWVMGETSAKSMRGSGMEDVIFSGTSNKTSKNIAEVSVAVENKNNEAVTIQPTQKIAQFTIKELPRIVINYVESIEESGWKMNSGKSFIKRIKDKARNRTKIKSSRNYERNEINQRYGDENES